MDQLFLLRLVADLIKGDKVTPEQLHCARVIITNLIKHFEPQQSNIIGGGLLDPELDADALKAQEDLLA